MHCNYDAIIQHDGMPSLKPGDTITCRISVSEIVSPYKNYDDIKSFLIVATDNYGYYLYVPHYEQIKGSGAADKYFCKKLGIAIRFLNEEIVYIQEHMVASIERQSEGMCCKKCRELYSYAESNQEDGTLICFSCRQNPYL